MRNRILAMCVMLAASAGVSSGMQYPKETHMKSGRPREVPNSETVRDSIVGTGPARVLWSKKLSSLVSASEGVVLWKNQVAASIASTVVLLDVANGTFHRWGKPGPELFQTITVDDDGHFLVAGQHVYAIDQSGSLVWEVALPSEAPIMDEWAQCRLAYWSASKMLVAGCNNGYVSGVQVAGSGKLAWSQRVYQEGAFDMSVGPGRGSTFVVGLGAGHDNDGNRLLNGSTGEQVLALQRGTGGIFSANRAGFLASSPSLSLLDTGRNVRLRVKPDDVYRMPLVTGYPDEHVMVMERAPNESPRLSIFSLRTLQRVAGPRGQGTPVAAGADGTFYALSCDISSREVLPNTPWLIAYDGALREIWKTELRVEGIAEGHYPCPKPGVALGSNGVMYILVESGGTYLLAVQTKSPGPANTDWPLRFGNNAGWRWSD